MNVTEHNEVGATEEQQLQLVGHMGHEKRTALKHYDKSRHVHMRRSKSVTGVMRDAESRTSRQVIPRKRSAERLQWQARVIVIVMSPHHGSPNTPSPPRSMTTLVAVLRVVSPSRTSQQVIPRKRSADRLQWQARVIVIVMSPPRRPQYPVPASLDDDVGSRAKGGVPKRSKPSKTGAPWGTASRTPSGAAGALPEGEVRDYWKEVPAQTNVPHEIEGEDSDIIRDTDVETQLEQARTSTSGSEQGPSDPDGAAFEPARTTTGGSLRSSDNNHSGAEENIAWYNSTPNVLLLDFIHAIFEKPMIAMFERDEYRKILLSGKKGSLPWQTVTQVLLQSDHPFAQRFAQRSGDRKYFSFWETA